MEESCCAFGGTKLTLGGKYDVTDRHGDQKDTARTMVTAVRRDPWQDLNVDGLDPLCEPFARK